MEVKIKCNLCSTIQQPIYPIETAKDCNSYLNIPAHAGNATHICKSCVRTYTKVPSANSFGYHSFNVELDWFFPKEGDVPICGEAFIEPFGKNGYLVKLTDGHGFGEYEWMFQVFIKGNTVTGEQSKKYRYLALEILDLYKKQLVNKETGK
jgi:hypothetical protein